MYPAHINQFPAGISSGYMVGNFDLMLASSYDSESHEGCRNLKTLPSSGLPASKHHHRKNLWKDPNAWIPAVIHHYFLAKNKHGYV